MSSPSAVTPPIAVAAAHPRQRIESIDILRGLVMVVMLLDHMRDFVHWAALRFDPTDIQKTTPLIFLTRFITHYCAPIFVFLAGTSAFLQAMRGKPKTELSWFLFTRGLWLVVCELTLVKVGVTLAVDYSRSIGFIQVIGAIGASMMVLAGLVFLPRLVVGAFGALLILGHNAFDAVHVPLAAHASENLSHVLWTILHDPGDLVPLGDAGPRFSIVYPLVPWVGVMALGYAFGGAFSLASERRSALFKRVGYAFTAGFFALRLLNIYGDPEPWKVQDTLTKTLFSFLHLQKYPPSLDYLLITLGPGLLLLAALENRSRAAQFQLQTQSLAARFFHTFGQVPLFYYLLQWPLASLTGRLLHWMIGLPAPTFESPPVDGAGFSLAVVYLCWIIGVFLLYPLCKWFAGVKRRNKSVWLSYL